MKKGLDGKKPLKKGGKATGSLYLSSKWTSKEKVAKCLSCGWTKVTRGSFWSKRTKMVTQGQHIHNELVMGLPKARKEGATPNALPDVHWRNS